MTALGRPAATNRAMARQVADRPAANSRDMARRVATPRSGSARRFAVIACVAVLAGVALLGMLHPLSAAGGTDPAATASLSAVTGVGTVWDADSPGAGVNWLDLITKGAIVLALLYVTLRVLGRNGVGAKKRGGRLEVLESRTLASKASLHLVAIGDRRLVVGLTPSGMVSLAELDAAELETEEAAADASTAATAATAAAPATTDSFGLGNGPAKPIFGSVGTVLWPLDLVAGKIALLFNGGRAR
jgi:flagellar biogenesis protein FliO